MECILSKIRYAGLDNHRKDVNNPKTIPADPHFKTHVHNFMNDAKFYSNRRIEQNIKCK